LWKAWNCEVTQAFVYIALHPYVDLNVDSAQFHFLEQFTVIIYDKTSHHQYVNEARQELFCQKEKSMDRLPLTQDALLQHARRAAYQAGVGAPLSRLIKVFYLQKVGRGYLRTMYGLLSG